MAMRAPTVLLTLLAAACGDPGEDDRPLDGGQPLGAAVAAESMEGVANRDCFRAERGRWHHSVGHCQAMLPARETAGVWVTAFEESSFFPGAAAIPDANDPARFTREIELDDGEVVRLSGHAPSTPNGEAYLLTFTGRRTRDPWFDCHGIPNDAFVVDRLESARYLGPMAKIDRGGMRARYEAHAERLRGRLGKAQAEAVERCGKVPADPIETVAAEDQGPSQARPPGKAPAE
jgi:hypothetical protein